MSLDEFKKILKFTATEERISKFFNIPPDILIPLFLSIKYGGDWSIKTSEYTSVAVKERETIYNPERREGVSVETIYLLVNPRIIQREGKVHRIEKCGANTERELVQRAYRVKLSIDKGLIATIDPKEKIIKLRKLGREHLEFKGSLAFSLEHEFNHIAEANSKQGESIWSFDYVFED